MHKIILALVLSSVLLLGKAIEPKVMRASDGHHRQYYSNSYHTHDREEQLISSTAEISSVISIEGTSQITSRQHHSPARLSYLDNNRIDIIQNIAKGQGEHLSTLLTMMNISNDKKKLEKIQKSFEKLIYLSHNDFLNKLKEL
ncbi:MAG: Unknown protein [uncultured Sulfurovum sp.]|uniref:Uncharacterized protein n=1 Tax=uncultured Sulfurovum sp. TaxID=269237 RepID=A0A6S6T341_9BACT|nr:MAG: Unknown protein [uncultured Sulfurovum sp.]